MPNISCRYGNRENSFTFDWSLHAKSFFVDPVISKLLYQLSMCFFQFSEVTLLVIIPNKDLASIGEMFIEN